MTSGPPSSKRGDPRYPAEIQVEVSCKAWPQVDRLVTSNASRGGLFLRTDRAPPVGSALRLQVRLPDGKVLPLRATVIHVVTPEEAAATGRHAGCGARLDPAHSADLILLEAMSAAATAKSADEGRPPGAVKRPPTPQPGDPIAVRTDRPSVVIARMKPGKAEPASRLAACSSEHVFGIDYGTTFSRIALVRDGQGVVIPDEKGRVLVPSIVSYPASGGVLVGWDARERVATDPAHTVHSAKRLLGRPIDEVEVENQLAQQAYRATRGPGDQVVLEIGHAPLSIPQVAAEMMRLLKRSAERATGLAVEEVVLTVPVAWEEPQRQALRKAAELAGMRAVGLFDEPAAAGLAYGFGQERNEIAAFYDFSGGTFDFTLVDISRDAFRILASAGDSWLGGDDFDFAIARDVANQFWKEHKIELQKRLVEWQRVLWACEAAKRMLTETDRAVIDVPGVGRDARGPIGLHTEITRERFERLCGGLIERSLAVAARAMEDAGLEIRDVGQVVLTGGSTRIPKIRAAVSAFFQREVDAYVSPDEAVALGAAVQGALLAERFTR